jgi:activating signal cointegrator complex subunit 1
MLIDVSIDASELPEEVRQTVSDAVPAYTALVTTSKLNVIHAVISKILVDEVFGVYFFGLPNERISQIRMMEQYLRTIGMTTEYLICVEYFWHALCSRGPF